MEAPVNKNLVCDICSEPNPKNEFPCIDFIAEPLPVLKSISSFVLCNLCALDVNDEEKLIKRAKIGFIRKYGFWFDEADSFLRVFIRQFQENRIRIETK